MDFTELSFLLLIALIFYSYFGYALLLFVMVQFKRWFYPEKNNNNLKEYPIITLVIPAYNEREYIDSKMQNTSGLNYPKDKLNIVWITDGSNDGSAEYLNKKYVEIYSDWNIKVYHQPERRGKSAAINRVMNFVNTDIVVFCDANTFLNKDSLVNIVRHFEDERVGCVAGEKRVLKDNTLAGDGESLYWRYESLVKKLNSDFYTCIGAVGELIAFRKSLFVTLPEDTILDDFVISMQIAHKGYKVVYEPQAYADEYPSVNEKEEMKRKIRIAAGAFQCLFRYPQWMNVFQHPVLSFQYISHKVSRWLIVPFSLPVIFILNVILFFQHPENIYYFIFLFLQLFFYFIVLIQYFASLSSVIFRIPYYVLMMNMAMYKGFWNYVTKKQSAVWEKVKRRNLLIENTG